MIKVKSHQYRWSWSGNTGRTFSEVASMVVTWWMVAFLCDMKPMVLWKGKLSLKVKSSSRGPGFYITSFYIYFIFWASMKYFSVMWFSWYSSDNVCLTIARDNQADLLNSQLKVNKWWTRSILYCRTHARPAFHTGDVTISGTRWRNSRSAWISWTETVRLLSWQRWWKKLKSWSRLIQMLRLSSMSSRLSAVER